MSRRNITKANSFPPFYYEVVDAFNAGISIEDIVLMFSGKVCFQDIKRIIGIYTLAI